MSPDKGVSVVVFGRKAGFTARLKEKRRFHQKEHVKRYNVQMPALPKTESYTSGVLWTLDAKARSPSPQTGLEIPGRDSRLDGRAPIFMTHYPESIGWTPTQTPSIP